METSNDMEFLISWYDNWIYLPFVPSSIDMKFLSQSYVNIRFKSESKHLFTVGSIFETRGLIFTLVKAIVHEFVSFFFVFENFICFIKIANFLVAFPFCIEVQMLIKSRFCLKPNLIY